MRQVIFDVAHRRHTYWHSLLAQPFCQKVALAGEEDFEIHVVNVLGEIT